jgi:diguanylate cyclase (GGDEF)-like protein
MAGGTPNYAARLLKNFPGLGRYVALGYFIGWVAVPALYAIVLTDLIKANLEPLGIACPETILKIGFTCVAFIVGFSGTRALGILHLFFVIPAVTFLLTFCFQGLGWLAFSTTSPGFFPAHWSSFSFGEWAKWFFIATYSVYSCETASSFVADSRRPSETLRFLSFAASLIPPVFLGGSWVLMQLATQPGMGNNNLYLNLLAAANPFWGQSASFLVTLLIAFSCLLSCATAVSNTPRILYQLALDGHLSPVFTGVSRRGVLGPALMLAFLLSLLCLVWGDISHVVMVTGTGYLMSIMGIHLGLWLGRGRPEVRWPWLSLCFFIVEAVVLIVGGLAWDWHDLLIGLLFPIVILAGDAALRRIAFAPFHLKWWLQRYHAQSDSKVQDFVVLQVIVLILLICSAATIGWVISGKLDRTSSEPSANILVVLLVTLSFIGVAIACWTTLPQIAAIDEAREQAKNLFITTLDTVPDTVLVLDENGTIRQTNAAAEELFQMNTRALVGRHLSELFFALTGTPDQWPSGSEHTLEGHSCLRIIESTISQQSNRKLQEYVVILRDITKRKRAEEELRQYRCHLEQLVEDRSTELIKVNKQLQQDIAERRRAQEQLLHNVFHDGLTGLPNQALFMERLRLALERAKRRQDYLFAVLFLDLDRFKVVNDSLGHMVGNQLLIAIARRLEAVLRSVDTVARFGGDEFTILLEDIEDISTAIHLAERIQEALALPFNLNENEVFTNASIGIVLSSRNYDQPEHLLRDADIAMYRAKTLGKARYKVFNTTMHNRAVVLLQLETDLRRAIKREEFRIYYQPIVSLVTGRIIGFEALVRWHHPERGLISPMEFIPVAEETGMIVFIGQWVLHEACRQMHTWQAQFPTTPPLIINVNLSGKQLTQPDLIKQIDQVLHNTRLDARSLKLEITESVIIDNTESAIAMLSQLRTLNIELQMDDFGTGYSSLSYLHRLPINTLKIDRSFISNIGIRGENLEIVRAIVKLAHSLNMDVTAEGIETVEKLSQLRALRCDRGQGYFFSRPLESKAVEVLLATEPQW